MKIKMHIPQDLMKGQSPQEQKDDAPEDEAQWNAPQRQRVIFDHRIGPGFTSPLQRKLDGAEEPPRGPHSPVGRCPSRPPYMTRTEWDKHGKDTEHLRQPKNHVTFTQLFEVLRKTKDRWDESEQWKKEARMQRSINFGGDYWDGNEGSELEDEEERTHNRRQT